MPNFHQHRPSALDDTTVYLFIYGLYHSLVYILRYNLQLQKWGLWLWNLNLVKICVQCTYSPTLIILFVIVQKLACWQTNKQTSNQRVCWKHPPCSALLCYTGEEHNSLWLLYCTHTVTVCVVSVCVYPCSERKTVWAITTTVCRHNSAFQARDIHWPWNQKVKVGVISSALRG